MNDEPKFKDVEVTKIGPLWRFEGDIILYPSISYPLKGYSQKDSKLTDEFFKSIHDWAGNWWESFPNCCELHKRFNSLPDFNKQKYSFIRNQILLSTRYFIHCMEDMIDKDNWFKNISQYYDYLNMNFGSPGWGDHIFQKAVVDLVEKLTFDNAEFTDDMRLRLLNTFHLDKKNWKNGEEIMVI